MARMRLDRMLAQMGFGTRSQVREMVRAGRVTVDGAAARDAGLQLDPDAQETRVDGQRREWKAVRTVMLTKPLGVVTAARDPKQPTVMDLLPPLYRAMGCMPAGRLDKDTEGMLVITNDGQLAHRLITPGKEVGKLYEARVDGPLGPADAAAFAEGIAIRDADGSFDAKPARLRILSAGDQESVAQVYVTEGKYHQVRRMFASRGRQVLALTRLAIGGMRLDGALAPGEWREMTPEEIRLLETEPTE